MSKFVNSLFCSRKIITVSSSAEIEDNTSRKNEAYKTAEDVRKDEARQAAKAKRVEKAEKLNAKMEAVLSDIPKFVRIVRAQIARGTYAMVTFGQIAYCAEKKCDSRALEFRAEYIAQERRDGVPEIFSDEQILAFWKLSLPLGKVLGVNVQPLVAQYLNPVEGKKPYMDIVQMVKTMCHEDVCNTSIATYIEKDLRAIHAAAFEGDNDYVIEDLEVIRPGFVAAIEEVYFEDDGEDW